jgi:hypothetical protein
VGILMAVAGLFVLLAGRVSVGSHAVAGIEARLVGLILVVGGVAAHQAGGGAGFAITIGTAIAVPILLKALAAAESYAGDAPLISSPEGRSGMHQMPEDVSIRAIPPLPPHEGKLLPEHAQRLFVVELSTPLGVHGQAYAAVGSEETSYEVVSAQAIAEPPGATQAEKERLVQVGSAVGEYEVVGWIALHDLDEQDRPVAYSVMSKGFTFHLDEDDLPGGIAPVGSWVRLTIKDLTLWASRWPIDSLPH